MLFRWKHLWNWWVEHLKLCCDCTGDAGAVCSSEGQEFKLATPWLESTGHWLLFSSVLKLKQGVTATGSHEVIYLFSLLIVIFTIQQNIFFILKRTYYLIVVVGLSWSLTIRIYTYWTKQKLHITCLRILIIMLSQKSSSFNFFVFIVQVHRIQTESIWRKHVILPAKFSKSW